MNHGIDLGKNLKKLQDRRLSERKSLRYKKFVAETVKYIIKNNDIYLSNNDIKEIAINVYTRYDKIIHQRIRSMMTQEVVKNDINSELQRILTDRGIKPLDKVIDLTQRGEEAAKNTSDFISVAKFYKEIAEIEPKKGAQARYSEKTIDYSTIGKDKDGKEVEIHTETKKIITKEIATDTPDSNCTDPHE